jgi:CRISPR/Cas system-associated exonuclease Cas4 (RecB family)
VWRAIQAGQFFPSPSPLNCHSCPYREPCRAWSG